MSKVKQDLGPEAVILQTKKLTRGGFLGFFAKVYVQVTAAIDEKNAVKNFRRPLSSLSSPTEITPPAYTESERLQRDFREVKEAVETLTKLLGTIFNLPVVKK